MSRTSTLPVGVASEGGLLPEETLRRISTGNDLPGAKPADYRLGKDETVTELAERAWTYLRGRYASFKEQVTANPGNARVIAVAREQWLGRLFQELGFGHLPRTPDGGLVCDDGEKRFAISHHWQHVPIHQTDWIPPAEGDRKTAKGINSAAQSLVQEYLNRSSAALWGIVTNGWILRVLRDSSSLAGSAYVEFDLEAIFEGEAFDAFVLLYRVVHVTRFEVQGEDAGPASCWLEKWRQEAVNAGVRVLDQLRITVKEAIETLGTGFLRHPDNEDLRNALADQDNSEVTPETLHRALLRTVYRLLFLFVAEDREVLLDPNASPQARDRYTRFFSTERLRRIAARRHGGRHSDQWQALTLVLEGLGREGGRPELGLPALGGLFELSGVDVLLHRCSLANEHLLEAVRSLSRVRDPKAKRIRRVDFKHLGSEELGSVYESLLEYVPKYDPAERTFVLRKLGGNERKTSGSYYTPASLIEVLLDSALDPVINDALKSGRTPEEQEKALLSLTVCDPACGSGHFLVAAARRIAKQLAFVRTGDPEPSLEAVRHALREVVARCIYGVDINPMAIELAKVSLWLEAMEPGKPLSFLDAHLKVGNALLSATPKLLAGGLPDEAFTPTESDDREWVGKLKKRNKDEREEYERRRRGIAQNELFSVAGLRVGNNGLACRAIEILNSRNGGLSAIRAQAAAYRQMQRSSEYLVNKEIADAWCAAFVCTKTPEGAPVVTTRTLLDLREGAEKVDESTRLEIRRLAAQYRFFHWHLEFPEIFRVPDDENDPAIDRNTGWAGGFSCVLGNPPWERIAFDDEEFFKSRAPRVLEAKTTAERKALISAEIASNPPLAAEYHHELCNRAKVSNFIGRAGLYSFTSVGRLTTQGPFTELSLMIVDSDGRAGLIVPTTVITAVPMKKFWEWLVRGQRLRGVLDFENSKGIFPQVHRSTKFTLLTLSGRRVPSREEKLKIGVFIRTEVELLDPDRVYDFPLDVLEEINPITKQLPICRSRREVELLLSLSRAARPHLKVVPWVGLTSDGYSKYYKDVPGKDVVPLYEGKMIHQYDACFASYEGVSERNRREGKPRQVSENEKIFGATSRFYLDGNLVEKFLERKGEFSSWILVVRDYVRSTDERTAIAAAVPRTVPIQPLNGFSVPGGVLNQAWALAAINSFPYEFMAKQKTPGQHFNVTIMSQVPVPSPNDSWISFVADRVLELTYTSPDLKGFAVALGDEGAPFLWNNMRRERMRVELDALFFHLYGVDRDDVDFIMESFSIVKKRDMRAFGKYRTKELILEVYDAMAQAIRTGEPYQTILDPAPRQGPRHPESSQPV